MNHMGPGEISVYNPPPLFEVSIRELHVQADGPVIGELIFLQRVENLSVESIVVLVNGQIELNAKVAAMSKEG